VSSEQLSDGRDLPTHALGDQALVTILENAVQILREPARRPYAFSRRRLALAMIDSVANLERGYYGDHLLEPEGVRSPEIRTALFEAGRGRRLREAVAGAHVLFDDRRPPGVAQLYAGPFRRPFSRLRVALLPGEADHVRIYDLKVGSYEQLPLGASVIDRLPAYRPDMVREGGLPVDLGDRVTRRYLPGKTLAGRLRVGAEAMDPNALRPGDLLGGVTIDLGRELPPMSYVYLVYDLDPGHVLCAVVEPLEAARQGEA
jgi:hypothetical protein